MVTPELDRPAKIWAVSIMVTLSLLNAAFDLAAEEARETLEEELRAKDSLLSRLSAQIEKIPQQDSFHASKRGKNTCRVLHPTILEVLQLAF